MNNKISKSINTNITFRKTPINKLYIIQQTKSSTRNIGIKKSSSYFGKTNINFKSNLTLSPIYNELNNKYNAADIGKKTLFQFTFKKAPTMKENAYKINKLIRLKKNNRIKELDKVHNDILISEAESYISKLYITSNDIKEKNKNNLTKNQSCKEFHAKNFTNKHKTINNITSAIKPNNFHKTAFNFIPSKKLLDENILKNKKILSTLLKDDSEKEANYALNSMSKMRIQLIESLHNRFAPIKLVNLEGRLVKFKMLQDIQNKNMKIISTNNEFIKKGYIKRLKLIDKTFQRKYENYLRQMKSYLRFLKNLLEELKENITAQNAEIFDLSSHIQKIMIKIIKKEAELENLLEIRSIILKLKDKLSKKEQPEIYYELLLIKDSKILLIEKLFEEINLIKEIYNKSITQFMAHIHHIKYKISNEDNNLDLNLDLINSLNLENDKSNEILSSPEAFIKICDDLTDKDLNLLNIYLVIIREKNNLEQFYKSEKNFFKKENENILLNKEIKNKEIEKRKLIEKNQMLRKKFSIYNESTSYEINYNQIVSLKHQGPLYLNYNVNLNVITRDKYYQKMKELKYKGLLLLDKLINVIKNFFSLNHAKEDFFQNFHDKNRLFVLDININTFNKDNAKYINGYVLKAISIYEEICEYILFTHKNLKKNNNNSQMIKEIKNNLDYNKKILNAAKEKEAKRERGFEDQLKIYEKAVKPVIYISSKPSVENKVRKEKIKKEREKRKVKNYEEEEFNCLTKYYDEVL